MWRNNSILKYKNLYYMHEFKKSIVKIRLYSEIFKLTFSLQNHVEWFFFLFFFFFFFFCVEWALTSLYLCHQLFTHQAVLFTWLPKAGRVVQKLCACGSSNLFHFAAHALGFICVVPNWQCLRLCCLYL